METTAIGTTTWIMAKSGQTLGWYVAGRYCYHVYDLTGAYRGVAATEAEARRFAVRCSLEAR